MEHHGFERWIMPRHELEDVVIASEAKVRAAAHVEIALALRQVLHHHPRVDPVESGTVAGLHDGRIGMCKRPDLVKREKPLNRLGIAKRELKEIGALDQARSGNGVN